MREEVDKIWENYKSARAQVYSKYKDINYTTDGDKVYIELKSAHDNYASALAEIKAGWEATQVEKQGARQPAPQKAVV